ASNRADLIDPAILRPGRIDRKIKVNRPNREGARDIYRIYLTPDLPYDGALSKEAEHIGAAVDKLIERFVDWQFARREENKFLEVTLRSGRKEILYRSDLISGAIIASIVERAKALLQDTDESAYYEIDKNRPLSFEEIKSDLVLSNGARFYNDHAHPEYSTPECTTLRQIVTQDKAGERILAECARRRNLKLPAKQEVRLYKNN